jgi:hypothetical protein
MTKSIDSFDDIILMSDITARIDELREERDGPQSAIDEANDALDVADGDSDIDTVPLYSAQASALAALDSWDDAEELAKLESLADELQGMGGDHQWEGNWYPACLIRDSHFKDYAMALADDCGMIPDNASWPMTCIDWDQAARELQMDYSSVEIDGVTYWTR